MEDTVSCRVTVVEEPEPVPPTPDDNENLEPTPPAPDESGEIEVVRKALEDYGYNAGYGYTYSFCGAWGETLPAGLSYASSDPAVVVINEEGRFTTLSAGGRS